MAAMKPGDVRVFKRGEGKAIAIAMGVWAARERDHIRIDITACNSHTTITNDPKSKRYHRTLFRNLRKIMVENDVWQFGIEGSETDEK